MQFNVYKLTCDTTGLVYYGSTKNTLNTRLTKHKNSYKRYLEGTGKKDCTSYQVLKNNNYKIILLETCFHVPHMVERETYYKEHNECVNKYTPAVAGRTMKEYYEDNREKILQKKKQKYTCECGSTLRIDSKTRHERRKKHQDFINKKK